jgi:hypothetical protein
MVMLVPYLLATWALATETRPVFAEIDDEELDHYTTKILRLQNLSENAILLWNAIPSAARDLMINMWLTRPRSRSTIAHPTPTIQQALHTVQSDPHLTPEERILATTVIPAAVGKQGNRLFSDGN